MCRGLLFLFPDTCIVCMILLLRRHMGELGADIEAVISNHEDARELVEQFGLKYCYFPITGKTRSSRKRKS